MKRIIGIDCGGTKTEFVLCDENGRVLKRALRASGNPVDVGLNQACELLYSGICELLNIKDGKDVVIDGMFVGVSGGSVSDNSAKIHSYIAQKFPLAHFQNGSDAMNVISAGLGDDEGIILIAGTGCVAFARCGSRLYRIGGWGYLFDGAGGGYDLGQRAIQAALKEIDGTGEKTYLSCLIEKKLGMDAGEALTKFYEGGKRYIASFAPLVFAAFRKKDAVAEQIINDTIAYWGTIINKAKQNVPHESKIVLAGSLFKQKEIILPMLREQIGDDNDLIFSEISPVFGAVREGMKLVGAFENDIIRNNFLNTYNLVKS